MSKAFDADRTNSSLNLHVGEWVEVKSIEEILATLDGDQCVDRLPYMPEMIQNCGKRFRVFRSAHKTPDTIELFTIRRMTNAVHLEELRCDGSSHGGCQAGCLIYWKECWIKRVSGPNKKNLAVRGPVDSTSESSPAAGDLSRLFEMTKRIVPAGDSERYRCQATEIINATHEVRGRDRWKPGFYVRDLTSGNVTLFDFIRFGLLAMLNSFLLRWFGWRFPRIRGLAGDKTPSEKSDLQKGELVRVKSKKEIMRTLNRGQRNQGLWFDVEMVPYCNTGNYKVLRRVERIINEKTGEMMKLPNPCIILDGVVASGNYSTQRMFGKRHEYIYWREIWLQRVERR
jgi:hypothetical protein